MSVALGSATRVATMEHVSPIPGAQDAALEVLERRAELIATRPRTDAELAELTSALERLLAEPATVDRVQLEGPDADEPLARHLAAMEPVNPVADETDLLDRFAEDRRVFVLRHRALGNLPANVVWVALRKGIPNRLGEVIDPEAPTVEPADADTAVFYSIWNVQPGLAGMGGGRELIEGVVARLADELPSLHTYVTLSPVPGLRRWLESAGFESERAPSQLDSLAARYLSSMNADGRMLDPVGRFHLGNGASLHRVCEDADPSELGISRSWGVMANYRYEPENRAANRAALTARKPVLGEQPLRLLGLSP